MVWGSPSLIRGSRSKVLDSSGGLKIVFLESEGLPFFFPEQVLILSALASTVHRNLALELL